MGGGDNDELGRPRIGRGDSDWPRASSSIVGLDGGLAGRLWVAAALFEVLAGLARGWALSGYGCRSSGGRPGGVGGLSPGK